MPDGSLHPRPVRGAGGAHAGRARGGVPGALAGMGDVPVANSINAASAAMRNGNRTAAGSSPVSRSSGFPKPCEQPLAGLSAFCPR
jgi:hypothetical protein